ncbi:FIGNL1-interacting regulator of recombination and mitosis-like [Periplaneta americana]|uniref:FIGNL1-interacting regulator of recombination and mitosis-like n=1 Tax=Periplaneta americana TaxID=6978 RepID=UPI0037E99163
MSSSNSESFYTLVDKLSEWTTKEVEENLTDILPTLLSILKCQGQKSMSIQAVQALLSKCLPCIPVENVEEKLLQHVLPSTEQLFNETLEGIEIKLQAVGITQDEDLLESLNGLLQVCIELLNCTDCALQYILTVGKVEAALVPSLPRVTASVLLEAFKHCKESENLYGATFQSLGAVLTLLFQKSRDLQSHFLEVVSENLQFKCTYEDELVLLTDIVDTLGRIGMLVVGLDVKTMAEQWKGYARLAFQYVDHLKPRLDLVAPLQFLASDISQNLEKIVEMDPPDMKFVTRTVKVGSFTLKIIIKLCDQYNGYLGACHHELLYMLLTIYRYSPPCLQIRNVTSDVIQNIETHLTIGAEPLLTHLVAEVEFKEKVLLYGEKLEKGTEHRLAFVLLCVAILKKLLHSDPDVRKLWLGSNPADHLLFVLFRTLDHCHAELNLDLQIPGVMHSGEPERATDLYEFILTHVAGFIMSVTAEEFAPVEQILLESVLQPTVWRALLATDVWCIVARSGSSDLCVHQLCHLVQVLKFLGHHHGHPEKTFLTTLIGRLFAFLPNKHKVQMADDFPPQTELVAWQALGVHVLPDKLKLSVAETLIKSAILHTNTFLAAPTSLEQFSLMEDALAAAARCAELKALSLKEPLTELTALLTTLWQRVAFGKFLTAEETSVEGCEWLEHFASVLCSVSAPLTELMSNNQLVQVLDSLRAMVSCGSSSVKLKTLTVLNSLAKKPIDPTADQMKIFHHIATLFSMLLQDRSPLVQQMTLEVFTYFAHVSSHESILALSVKNSADLQQKTKRYLQKLPAAMPDQHFLAFESYLECQARVQFSHRCKMAVAADEQTVSECIAHPPKKVKLAVEENSGVLQAIERLKNDASFIADYCKLNTLPSSAQQDVLQVATQLRELCL